MIKEEIIEFTEIINKIVDAPLYFSTNFENYLRNMVTIERLGDCSTFVMESLSNTELSPYDISFIDITDKEDTISFTPIKRIYKNYKKIHKVVEKTEFLKYLRAESNLYSPYSKGLIKNYNGVWKKGRVEMKIGKFLKRIFLKTGNPLTDKEIEIFVNKYKCLFKLRKNPNLSFVKGSEIEMWYDQVNYAFLMKDDMEGLGTLGKSCMRYGDSFFDLYTKNHDVCQLLILKSETDTTKIIGRALVWVLEDGKYYMDRVYTHFDSDAYIFKNYAEERGWEYYQAVDKDFPRPFTVKLQEANFATYPYADTFGYVDIKDKIASSFLFGTNPLIQIKQGDGGYSGVYRY